MIKTDKQMASAAAEFAQRWKGRGYERGESQPFWIDLLTNVFGIETPSDGFITFEDHRMVDSSNFIDGRIPSTRVLIEQKRVNSLVNRRSSHTECHHRLTHLVFIKSPQIKTEDNSPVSVNI